MKNLLLARKQIKQKNVFTALTHKKFFETLFNIERLATHGDFYENELLEMFCNQC